ncbi:MAG: hypothetical protein PT118_11490, partial [Aphanizomenon gracile PMC644.10]|nr:hypothetical protein [Aphanizomenon gracile PMC644.10]
MGVSGKLEAGAIIITFLDSGISLVNDSSPINILSNTGQLITAFFSKSPGGTIAFAPAAAVVTVGKIITDAQNGQTISAGDVLSVTGNAIAIIGTVGALVSTAPVTIPAAALGLALAGLGALSNTEYGSSQLEKIRNFILDMGNPGLPNLGGNYDPLGNFIGDLQTSFNQAQTISSPIILDLDGNGVDTISKSAGVHFDLDGNKFAETTGWVGKNDGLLVLDKNGNGKIDDGSELFGNNTLLKNGNKAANGFAALSELDSNKDSKIDAADSDYSQLRVWKDSNSNGVVDTGELLTLIQAGVKSLNTGFTNQTQTDAQGNQHLQVGNYTRTDGSTRAMNDVWFATDTARTIDQDLVTVNATIAALPELQGFGNVHSLQQAMARDTTGNLQNLVTQFATTTDTAAHQALFKQILFSWSGADKYAVNSRGGYLTDGRILYAIEAFLGQRFVQGSGTNAELNDPGPNAAAALQTIYDQLYQTFYAQLMAQTHFKNLYDSINLNWNSTTNQFDLDVSATITALQTKYTADATAGAALILDFGNSLKTTGDFGQQVLAILQKQGNITGQGFAFSLATMGYNTINGTANNDTLNGINGKDNWLVGNGGNDNISGGNGNDIIDGGAGNDTLNGGYGNDIYIFNKGDGQDTISDYDPTSGNTDTIRFGTG